MRKFKVLKLTTKSGIQQIKLFEKNEINQGMSLLKDLTFDMATFGVQGCRL